MNAGGHDRIGRLAALVAGLGRPEPLSRVLEIAADGSRELLNAASASISRVEPGTGLVRAVINVGDLADVETRWPNDEVYEINEFTYLHSDFTANSWSTTRQDSVAHPAEHRLLVLLGKGCSAGAPILVDGHMWGEIYLTRHLGEPTFNPDDLAYLEALAAVFGGAISRALRASALERLAYLDALTGLANRRALDEQAHGAFQVPPGRQRTVTAVCVDINGLKAVNDTRGHPAGDQLIKAVAKALVTQFARIPGAMTARVGGDEFSVLVTGHPPAAVVESADALCRHVRDLSTGWAVSVGASSLMVTADSTPTPTDLFSAADRAQYRAKRQHSTSTVIENLNG